MWVRSLGGEDPVEKDVATHCSILAWKIPWTGEPGRLPCTGLRRVRRDWAIEHTMLSESRRWTLYEKWWCCRETRPPPRGDNERDGRSSLTFRNAGDANYGQECSGCSYFRGSMLPPFLSTHLPQRHLELNSKMFNMFLEGECFLSLW